MINHDNVLARPGNGGQNATPPPRPAGELLKHIPALFLVARQAPVQGAVRGRPVVGVVLDLGGSARQRAPLSGVLTVVHPNARAGVGKADFVLQTLDALVLVEEAALDAFLRRGSEVGGGEVDGQILGGGARAARAVVGDDGPVGQRGLFVGVADEEVLLWCVGAEIVGLLLLLASRVLDGAHAKDIVGAVQIFRIRSQFTIEIHGKLVNDATDGRLSEVDGIVLRRLQLALLVVVGVALELVGVNGPLATQGLDRGGAVLHFGPLGGTALRVVTCDAVTVTAHRDGILLRRAREEEPKQDGEQDRHDHREGDGYDAAAAGHV